MTEISLLHRLPHRLDRGAIGGEKEAEGGHNGRQKTRVWMDADDSAKVLQALSFLFVT